MKISKTRYMNYIQCPKRYWLSIFRKDLADERDMTVFKTGKRVGEIARGLFPGGVLIEYRHGERDNLERMVRETKEHIKKGAKVIYEAAFATDEVRAICDILVKTGNGYDVYEVKSSGSVKEVYLPDAAFQYYVLRECGINIRNMYVTHINTGYVRKGELEIAKLFKHNVVTGGVRALIDSIPKIIPHILKVYEMKDEPDIGIGVHCENPYTCEFMGHCFRRIGENSVFDLSGISQTKKYDLYDSGITYMSDIRDKGIKLKRNLMLQVDSSLDDQEVVNKERIRDFLAELHFPLYFLDFETINPAVPLYDGTSPFEQVPTQYSIHATGKEGAGIEHREFLAKEGQDPRRELAERLVFDIPRHAAVLAYHMSFEKKVIQKLADTFPDLRDSLQRINDNMHDLIIPFRKKYYYNKEMRGKSSIKYVLPALFPDDPELSYDGLEDVHNGKEAANAYLVLTEMNAKERKRTRNNLLEYCRLDTLAMVRIWERLREIAK